MRKSKTSTNSSTVVPPESDGGNFGVGFLLGLLGGITGMFLFGTKQGHEVLRDWKKQIDEHSGELITPKTKKQLTAIKQTATEWQDKFPKFPKKDPSV